MRQAPVPAQCGSSRRAWDSARAVRDRELERAWAQLGREFDVDMSGHCTTRRTSCPPPSRVAQIQRGAHERIIKDNTLGSVCVLPSREVPAAAVGLSTRRDVPRTLTLRARCAPSSFQTRRYTSPLCRRSSPRRSYASAVTARNRKTMGATDATDTAAMTVASERVTAARSGHDRSWPRARANGARCHMHPKKPNDSLSNGEWPVSRGSAAEHTGRHATRRARVMTCHDMS